MNGPIRLKGQYGVFYCYVHDSRIMCALVTFLLNNPNKILLLFPFLLPQTCVCYRRAYRHTQYSKQMFEMKVDFEIDWIGSSELSFTLVIV